MRRVRSQLDNLTSQPSGQTGMNQYGQPPVGYNPQTDAVQQKIEAMGLYPAQPPKAPQAPYPQMPQAYSQPYPQMATAPQEPNPMPMQAPMPAQMPMQEPMPAQMSMQEPMPAQMHMQEPMPAQMSMQAPMPAQMSMQEPMPAQMHMQEPMPAQMYMQEPMPAQMSMQAPMPAQMPMQEPMPAQMHMQEPMPAQMPMQAPMSAQMPMQASAPVQSAYPAQQSGNAPNPEMENIKAGLDRLTGKLQGIAQVQADSVAKTHTPPLESSIIVRHLKQLNSNLSSLQQSVAGVAKSNEGLKHLDELRAVIGANYSSIASQVEHLANTHTDPSAYAKVVETSHQDLKQQILNLNKMVQSLGALTAQKIGEYDFSPLESRMEEITRAIVALSAGNNDSDNLERIEARVSGLSKTIDEFVTHSVAQSPTQPNPEMTSLLNEVQGGIQSIESRIENIAPASATALDGMAAQINRLSEKLDNVVAVNGSIEGQQHNNDGALLGRLDTLVERVENIGAAADDSSGLVMIESQMGHFNSELQGIRETLNQGPAVSDQDSNPNAVLEQLQYITNSIESMSGVVDNQAGSNVGLDSLEQQITGIAQQLNSIGSPEVTLAPIENRLSGIENQLGASRDIAIEVASQAAEDAIQRTLQQMPAPQNSETQINAEHIASLSEELRKLNDNANNANTNSLHSFDTLKNSLVLIAQKLDYIETGMANQQPEIAAVQQPEMNPYQPEAQPQHPMGEPEHVRARQQYQEPVEQNHATAVEAELPQVETPELSLHEMPEVPVAEAPVNAPYPTDDAPLEPGASAPDLAVLVRKANQRRMGVEADEEVPSGTDFIAAARRAAQAASQEASAVQEDVNATSKKGLLKALPGLLKKRRKALVIAAAAILMIAVAIPTVNRFLGSSDTKIANVETPAITEQVNGATASDPQAEVADSSETLVTPASDVAGEEVSQSEPLEANSLQDIVEPQTAGELTPASEDAAASPDVEQDDTLLASIDTLDLGSDLLKQAAVAGDPIASFEIGRRYTDGIGVDRNLETAAKWYQKAANAGFAPAQYRVGNFYEKGHGVESNAATAARWYEIAANNGNIIAMHNLAVLHAEGKVGGSPDMASAFKWFKKAAEFGVRDSQVNVGIFFTNGAGTEGQNLVEAYKWFAVAAKAGDSDAASKRDVIAQAMRPDQLEEARAVTELWKPATPDAEANNVKVPDNWKATGSATSAKLNSDRNAVTNAQAMLAQLGFDPGPADGLMGNKTKQAIIAFQQRTGMDVTGKVSPELLDALKAVSI